MPLEHLVFLKLGGSLITDKTKPLTPRLELIKSAANEIAQALADKPELHLVIGHGSGSFGHAVASQYQTQDGVHTAQDWHGFAEVWRAARQLNQIMVENLSAAGIPIIAFPPSAGIMAENKRPASWDTMPFITALTHDLVPLVQGDVIFDTQLGGTIFSTEQVFQHLAHTLVPSRILLAGQDHGVYSDPQKPQEIIPHITPANYQQVLPALSGSHAADVTGGMEAKVKLMLSLVKSHPSLTTQIFYGAEPRNIYKALTGEQFGTRITA